MATITIEGRKYVQQSWKVSLFIQRVDKLIEKEKRNGTYFLKGVKRHVEEKGYYTDKQAHEIIKIKGEAHDPRLKIE